MHRTPSSTRFDDAPDDREPVAGEDRLDRTRRVRDDDDDSDPELGVARRINPLPLREEEEEELSEADILSEHDMEELDADDPDADDLAIKGSD